METLQVQGKTIILDGAHNAQKMQALLASIADKYPNMSAVAVVSFSGNQHDRWHEALQVLQKHVGYVIYTTFDVASDMPKRSVEHTLVAEYLQAHTTLQYDIQEDVGRAIDLVLGRPEQIVILSGSLYLLGDAKRVLGEML
jgi:dihydrofolate synthase/folylpolyglutamate synthase